MIKWFSNHTKFNIQSVICITLFSILYCQLLFIDCHDHKISLIVNVYLLLAMVKLSMNGLKVPLQRFKKILMLQIYRNKFYFYFNESIYYRHVILSSHPIFLNTAAYAYSVYKPLSECHAIQDMWFLLIYGFMRFICGSIQSIYESMRSICRSMQSICICGSI
jgi:hypothetical protein